MKQGNKNRNSPRLANAIRRAIAYASLHSSLWYVYHSDDLGRLIYEIAYKADKYDVLNALCSGTQQNVVTFARGDIRHKKKRGGLLETILSLIAVFIILTLFVKIGY